MNDIIYNKKILKKLFPQSLNKNIYNKLLIDRESKMYISDINNSNKISFIIQNKLKQFNILNKNLIITDATAGVGGNVLSFSKYFYKVNSIELDQNRYNYLVNNINCYNYTNIETFNNNCLALIFNFKQDIIFFDPPWGGYGYKEKKNIKLNLQYENISYSIESICSKLLDPKFTFYQPKIIVLKLPKNYEIKYLMNNINSPHIYIHILEKMYIITIMNPLLINKNNIN